MTVTADGGDLADVTVTVTLARKPEHRRFRNALTNTADRRERECSWIVDNTAPDRDNHRRCRHEFRVPSRRRSPLRTPVTGFVLTDITLTNATASNFTGADGETAFTALITPSANGAVTVDVAVDVAMDAAGNGTRWPRPPARASSTYDNTAPTVASIARQAPTASPANADSLTWRVTFSEAVANVDTADFTVTGTTATLTVAPVAGCPGAYDGDGRRRRPGGPRRHGDARVREQPEHRRRWPTTP